MSVKPIPEGYHSITPYLIVKDADKLIDFLKNAFGAKEIHRSLKPEGQIMHAEVQIGDSRIMMAEASDQITAPVLLYLYVEDVDSVYKQAIKAGGVSLGEPMDQFYGDRSGGVQDPSGNHWWIGTHVEDITPEEMKKREEEFRQKQAVS